MPDEKKDDKKEEDKVVLRVDMHCEACKEKVRKSVLHFPGLEKIDIDMKNQKVTIKGKVDVKKLYETIKKKSGKRTELISPQLKKDDDKKKEEKKEEKKKEPQDVTVVLKIKMHCGACAKEVKKALQKIDGVYDIKVDLAGEKVTVKGKDINPEKIRDKVTQKTGKHAEIVPPKKDEKKDGKKDGDKQEDGKKGDQKKSESSAAKSVPEYVYPPQLFSDENPNACIIM